ncbi:acylphosphatase [Noviherbaspirillum aridicola]|uniref:acylphosphatase n=1 Tax=Noviherbaspirillum aridicola TaxID=2849687 RepID=A0ABQ4Q8F6_9BURK|nr:acylphosphatase [Noviherbaspirillum aridicola]GIZ53443.1 acylphosphatase [Noviherbaspirillum aridicola]
MAKHLRITGRVQGVGYRAWFEARARALGLSGWVRNRADGSVEALVTGGAADVEQIIADAARGPAMSRVDDVEATPAEEPGNSGFRVLPTA